MTSLQQVQELAAMGVDFAGFIFYEKSPRYVGAKLSASDIKAVTSIQKVGVFVNETVEKILQIIDDYGLDMVQLHGDETPAFCQSLKDRVTVMKVFRVKGDEDVQQLVQPYEDAVHYFLFDTKAQEYGGTGKQFDWSVLKSSSVKIPYFLSGGIGPNDADAIKIFIDEEDVFAIDINSRFERQPGDKEIDKIRHFVRQLSQK